MRKIFTFLLITFFILNIKSSGQNLFSKKSISGQVNVKSVINTYDHGFLICGQSAGGYIMKIDSAGNLLWDRNFGYNSEIFQCAVTTPDSGFLLVGQERAIGAVICLRIDKDGNFLWTNSFVCPAFTTPTIQISSVINTSDNCFLLTGTVSSLISQPFTRMLVIKMTSTGALSWSATYLYTNWGNMAFGAKESQAGGYYLWGMLEDYPTPTRAVLVKISNAGLVNWSRMYFNNNEYLIFHDLEFTANGLMCLLGVSNTTSQIIMKTDTMGNPVWVKRNHYGDSTCYTCLQPEIHQTNDSGFMILSQGAHSGLYKIDSAGIDQGELKMNYNQSDFVVTPDEGYLVITNGFNSANQIGIIKIDSAFNSNCLNYFSCSNCTISDTIQTDSISMNQSVGGYPYYPMSLPVSTPAVTLQNGCLFSSVLEKDLKNEIEVFPNPCTNHLNIKFNDTEYPDEIKILSLLTQKNYAFSIDELSAGKINLSFDLSRGPYFLSLRYKNKYITKLLIVE